MNDKLEADDEDAVKKWCKRMDLLFIKFTPMGEKGWPDRIVPVNGYTLWIELKRKGKKPRPLQAYRIKKLLDAKQHVQWFDNAEDCINWIRMYL